MVTNPSIETNTTGYTAVGGGVARSAAEQYHGTYSLAITPTAGTTDGAYFGTVSLVSGTTYAVSCKVKGRAGKPYRLSVRTTGGADLGGVSFVASGRWEWRSFYYTETASTTRRIYLTKDSDANTAVFYLDGLQVEACGSEGVFVTTYIDGDQLGLVPNQSPAPYVWSGTPHASTSTRSGLTRAGGRVMPFSLYRFILIGIVGLGMAVPSNIATEFAQLDGGQYQDTRKPSRQFTLAGRLDADNYDQLRMLRGGLERMLDRDAASLDQPLILLHTLTDDCDPFATPTTPTSRIACVYAGGLGGNTTGQYGEDVAASFVQYLPAVQSDGEQGASLAVQQTISNANRILYRTATGQWTAMGTGAAGGAVYGLARGPDGTIYAGGLFTSMGGVANTDGIAQWSNGAWSAMGSGISSGTNEVDRLAVGPDGTLYAVGKFGGMGGVASTPGIARWSGGAWSAMGSGATGGVVIAVAVDRSGNVYAGGSFTAMGGVANTLRIAKWTGSAWSAMSTGADGDIYAIAAGPDGTIYAGGDFANIGGVAATRVAKWTGTAWSAMGTGMNAAVQELTVGPDGRVYAGGLFTTASGVTAYHLAVWNGVAWAPVGTGVGTNSLVQSVAEIEMLPSGGFLAGGIFGATVGGVAFPDNLAQWTGGTFIPLDADLPSTATSFAILSIADGTLYVGFDTSGSATAAGVTTVTNEGTARSYPTITIRGPSSGSSRIYQLVNFTTGRAIYLNYTIQAGEVATLSLQPDNLVLNSTFQGNISNTILAGSNVADFFLAPGDNVISFYAADATVEASMRWRPSYVSLDDVR